MSFLINALGKKIIDALETELINAEPFIAQALMSEAQMLFSQLTAYAESKLSALANGTNKAAQPVTPLPE